MVGEVETPTSGPTVDADETTSSPHQPINDQLAMVPLPVPTGDTPLTTDFQNELGLIATPSTIGGPFNSLSEMSMLCGGVSSDPSGVEKHDYDFEKAQTMPSQIHNPDDDTFHGSAMSRMPLSSDSYPQSKGMEEAAIEIGGLQSAVVKLQIQNGPSLRTPDNSSELFSIPPEACLSGGALSSEPNYAEKHEHHTQRTQATPVDIVFRDGSEPRIGCKESHLSPGLPDAVTRATEVSASSGSPAPASEVTLSSFSTPHLPCLQAPMLQIGGTQLSNDETQTTLVEPSSSTDIMKPARHPPSLPYDIQPLSHSNLAPAREACDPVQESQSPLYSEEHIRQQDYDPVDGSFPTATVNRGRYTGPNAMPVQYSPYESSQIRRSPVQDYYPNEPNYRLPRYRQGARYQGQRESSSASELTYERRSFGGQYQGQEYDVSRPYRVSNRWQRYYPVNDIPDDRPWSRGRSCPVNDIPDDRTWSHGGRHRGRDYHDSNGDNFDDVSQPFEVRYKEQVYHLGNVESDDMAQPHAHQYRKHDYSDGTNFLNDMRQQRRVRYQQQSHCLDERYLGEAPLPYGSHHETQEDWPAGKNCPAMPQPCRVHYQRQGNRLGDNTVDGAPPHHTSQYQGRQSWSSIDDFADVQRSEREPANFPGNNDFADMPRTEREPANFPGNNDFAYVPRTEQEPANFPGNDDFADEQRTERGSANFLSRDSIHNVASEWKDHSQRPEFAEFKSHDVFPTNHETQGGDFKGVYQTSADPEFQKDPHRSQRSCYRAYVLNHELQSQKDQYYGIGSASKDENTPQLTGENCATGGKMSSQAGEGVGCESGTLVCDNIVSVPNSVNVVIGERNRAGGRSGGRITGNRILR
ncbi:uncharacterized protein LOC120261068 [Dioscorea cayenensis subsp. rotundata]|uniref:Uncharacterized protein LOC120261068 n=1 Tax=Dioscorea cayennensis subsp. rotundata TaxID=55577 RepID=A0AB40BBK5_DIOCR|nr:uncharacterized protein LOC120261068 [Dioscorea cayenensis subsp. rotundata]